MISSATYLASIASARALYVLLFEDAKTMIPPHDPAKPAAVVPIASNLPATELGRRLGLSAAVVNVDLQRLVNFGWLVGKRTPRALGSREGQRYHLAADVVARAATGLDALVSREVLKLKPVDPTPVSTSSPQEGRGAKRKWRPTVS